MTLCPSLNGVPMLGVGVKPVRTLKPLTFPKIIFPGTPTFQNPRSVVAEKCSDAISVLWSI